MPVWPEKEKKMVLGYIAYLSQINDSKDGKGADDNKSRTVVWEKREMVDAIRDQLSKRELGRFTGIKKDDADELVKYFLLPAGLLVEPADNKIEFAHLSFQEYLCAEYIYTRAELKGMSDYLKKELFSRLRLPGWDEIGMLAMAIRCDRTHNEGHFELLLHLDPNDACQARLLVGSILGRELSFTEEEQRQWMPLVIAASLVHPDEEFAEKLAGSAHLRQEGIKTIKRLLSEGKPDGLWQVLEDGINKIPGNLKDPNKYKKMRGRWLKPKKKDCTWTVDFDEEEARAYSLLGFINCSGWFSDKEKQGSSEACEIENELTKWVNNHSSLTGNSPVLWIREKSGIESKKDDLPVATNAGLELDYLIPGRGELYKTVAGLVPLDAWLLQGESLDDDWFFWDFFSQPVVLLSIYPEESVSFRTLLSLGFYQVILFAQGFKREINANKYEESRSLSRSLSLIQLYTEIDVFSEKFKNILGKTYEKLNKYGKDISDELLEEIYLAVERFGYNYGSFEWFSEQAGDPGLVKRRGLRPGMPLPDNLGLFDSKGIPNRVQKRENIIRL